MNPSHHQIEILEKCNVSPPPNSVPTTSIPLTHFDIPWILGQSSESIYFYDFPHPTSHFLKENLPQLKESLSLTLQLFFPLVGSLVFPHPQPNMPHILYQNGDSIPLIVCESYLEFANLIKDGPKDAREFRPLVAELSSETILSSNDICQILTDKVIHPLLAIQVTVFPNTGISICFTFNHVTGDGRACTNFMKSWASISKFKNDTSFIEPQFYDRDSVATTLKEILPTMWNQWCSFGINLEKITTIRDATAAANLIDKWHSTFVLNRRAIEKLKQCVASQFNIADKTPPEPFYVSTFVVTCAFTWVCLVKTKNNKVVENADDCFYNFLFLADCTSDRMGINVPQTYIGNCVIKLSASAKKCDLLGENGLCMAAKAIMEGVEKLDNGLTSVGENWEILNLGSNSSSEVDLNRYSTIVAGYPRMGMYETDFGWGRPTKSEIIHIDKEKGVFSLMDSKEKGGVEIGMALNKLHMDVFTSIFQLDLKNLIN